MQVMLAGKVKDVNTLHYPVLVSFKLDGIRAFVWGGKVMSRNFKPIPNVHVQKLFAGLPEGTDGELILGEPTAPDAYRKTASAVMSEDSEDGRDVVLHVVDCIPEAENDPGFDLRYANYSESLAGWPHITIISQVVIMKAEELLAMESDALAQGYEGLMVRDPNGLYKHGRSSTTEGILLKLKRFEDSEALVYGFVPMMHNENEATENELGHTKRSTAKAGMVPLEMLGKFLAHDVNTGVEVECGTGLGLTKELRTQLWKERDTLPGRIIKYKFFPSGGKDKRRFPIWLGFRSPLDMDAKKPLDKKKSKA